MKRRAKRVYIRNFNFKLTFSDLDIVFLGDYNKTCKRSKKGKVKLVLWRRLHPLFVGFSIGGSLFHSFRGAPGRLFIRKGWL